jgi:hypothetical protein
VPKHTRASFISPNGKATLTIYRSMRRTNISVRASIKNEGDTKASTGAREAFALTDADAAQQAYDRLVADATSRGWLSKTKTQPRKQAFDTIPAAPVSPTTDAPKTKKAQAAGATAGATA